MKTRIAPLAAIVLSLALALTMIGTGKAEALSPPSGVKLATGVGAEEAAVTWTAVSGAPGYRVRVSKSSTFSSGNTYINTTSNNVFIPKLSNNTTYYVGVAVWNGTDRLTNYSSTYKFKTKYTFSSAPSAMEIYNVSGTSVEFGWVNVTGAPGFRVRAVPTSSGHKTVYGSTGSTSMTLKGLDKGTGYKLYVAVEQPADGSIPAIRIGPWSSSKSVKTSSYPLAAPSNLAVTSTTPRTAKLTWEPPAHVSETDVYKVEYALNTGMTDQKKSIWAPAGSRGITLGDTAAGYPALTPNTQYYVRVQVYAADKTTIRSDRTDYALAKTRVPLGYISGSVTNATAAHVVVAAFQGGELIKQVDTGSDGSYRLPVRPGNYRVKAMYIGTGSHISRWVSASAGGHRDYASSRVIEVTEKQTTNVPSVSLGNGYDVSGLVYNGDSMNPVSVVDVTALTANERQVVAVTRQNAGEGYRLRGLENGDYVLRFNYPGAGFKTEEKSITISGADKTNSPHLDLDTTWVKPKRPYASGSKKVGVTLKAIAKPWVAEYYPTTRSSATYVRWLRNGTPITDWCRKTTESSCSYKVTSSSRGKKLQVQSKDVRYGYTDGYGKSLSYTIR